MGLPAQANATATHPHMPAMNARQSENAVLAFAPSACRAIGTAVARVAAIANHLAPDAASTAVGMPSHRGPSTAQRAARTEYTNSTPAFSQRTRENASEAASNQKTGSFAISSNVRLRASDRVSFNLTEGSTTAHSQAIAQRHKTAATPEFPDGNEARNTETAQRSARWNARPYFESALCKPERVSFPGRHPAASVGECQSRSHAEAVVVAARSA